MHTARCRNIRHACEAGSLANRIENHPLRVLKSVLEPLDRRGLFAAKMLRLTFAETLVKLGDELWVRNLSHIGRLHPFCFRLMLETRLALNLACFGKKLAMLVGLLVTSKVYYVPNYHFLALRADAAVALFVWNLL